MTSQNFVVPPLSNHQIARKCDGIRLQFSLSEEPYFPVMPFLEEVLDNAMRAVRLEIADKKEMGNYEGFTDPHGEFIRLREDVYEKACYGNPRDRFTVAHELGHFFLHTGIPMARAKDIVGYKPYQLSEPQANRFAIELLAPKQFMLPRDTPETLALRHGISLSAADHRLRSLGNIQTTRKGVDM